MEKGGKYFHVTVVAHGSVTMHLNTGFLMIQLESSPKHKNCVTTK